MMSACVHPTSNSVQVLRFPRASTDAAVTALFQLRGQLATPISISREHRAQPQRSWSSGASYVTFNRLKTVSAPDDI